MKHHYLLLACLFFFSCEAAGKVLKQYSPSRRLAIAIDSCHASKQAKPNLQLRDRKE
jgi:hypothetical protein